MNKRFIRSVLLVGALLCFTGRFLFAQENQGGGNEPTPCDPQYGEWFCVQQGALTSGYGLSPSNVSVNVGQVIISPTAYGLTMTGGLQGSWVTYPCNDNTNHFETNSISYTLGSVYFVPPVPDTIWTPGVYAYTAKVNATGSPCATLTNIIGTYTVTVGTNDPDVLFDIVFGKQTNTTKPGYAAIGNGPGDYWNSYAATGCVSGVLTNLKTVERHVSPVGLLATNLPFIGTNVSADKMYSNYLAAASGQPATLTLTNLPAGTWSVYLYASDGSYQLSIGTNSYGAQTCFDQPLSTVFWQQGIQYVVFTNVVVSNSLPLTVTITPGSNGVAMVSGLQIASANHAPSSIVSEPVGASAWWRAEDNALDSIGTNNGTLSGGVTYTNGMVGRAFSLDGTNAYMLAPDSPTLNPSNAITVECWINRQAVVGTWDPVVKKAGFSGNGQVNGYGLEFNNNNIAFWIYNNSGWHASSSGYIQLSEWFHVAGVFTGSNLLCYVNGRLVGSSVAASGSIISASNPLCIGNDPGNPTNRFFKGLVDEVSVYNRALSSNEIADIYNLGMNGKSSSATDDSDYDGVSDVQELAYRTDPNNPNSAPQIRLGYWPFDNTNTWAGSAGQLPLVATTNILGVPSWNTNAALIDATNAAVLKYRDVETNGNANVNLRNGTIRFWFKPDWSSADQGGTGPQNEGRLIEVGIKGSTNGWWGLLVDAAGGSIYFGTQTNGSGTLTTNLTAAISWASNVWHQVVLTYSPSNSEIYLDGLPLIANGSGVTVYPGAKARALGFTIGGSAAGTNQAQGTFDELESFNYLLSVNRILGDYLACPPTHISNLRVWLKSDSLIGLNNNAPLSTWPDSSGSGNDATQVTSDRQPSFVTNIINGYPAIQFDGINDQLMMAASPATNDFTVFAVVNANQGEEIDVEDNSTYANGGSTGEHYLFGGDYNSGHPGAEASVSFGTNGVSAYEYMQNSTFGDQAAPMAVYGGDNGTNFSIVAVKYVNQQPSLYLNGVLVRTGLPSLRSQTVMAQSIGYGAGDDGSPFSGNVAEILIFDRAMTEPDQSTISAYLKNKYNIAIVAPSAPAGLKALTVSSNQINLTWDNAAAGPVEFLIERKQGATGSYNRIATEAAATSSCFDTNLIPGTTYYYRIQARNLSGASSYSNETNATTSATGAAMPVEDLRLWLKADAGVACGDNASVFTWQDQSGNSKNATQSLAAGRPAWMASVVGDRPTVHFDGVNNFLNLPPPLTGTSQAESFVVLKAANTPGGFWRMGQSGDGALAYPNADGHVIDDFGSANAYYDLGPPLQPLTQYHLYNVMSQDGDWAAWINGLLQFQTTDNSYGPNNNLITLGHQYSGYFAGEVAEILVFDRKLTSGERVTVGTYLASKYGLSEYYTVNGSVPRAPTNFIAVGTSPYQIKLQWDSIASVVHVERKDGPAGSFHEVGTVLSNHTNFVDVINSPSTEYFYRAKAHNYLGDSDYSMEIALPLVNISSPSATNDFVALGTTNALILNATDEYSAIVQAVAFYSYTNVPLFSTSVVPWTNNWIPTVEGQYTVTAVATDAAGNSRYSAPFPVKVFQDTDGDGIPDWWVVKYFGHATGDAADHSLALNDWDGDGVNNFLEYKNGTDPIDYYDGNLPAINIVGGADQVGNYNSLLASPVTIQVVGVYMTSNAPVTFSVARGTAQLLAATNGTPTNSLALRADSDGLVSVWVYFPPSDSNLAYSTLVASAFAGTNSISIPVNEYAFKPLGHWRFDDTNTWIGDQGQMPLLATNVSGIVSWSTNAVLVNSNNPSLVAYQAASTNGSPNIDLAIGTVLFYFKPDWTSTNAGGNGPGSPGRLIELGNYNPAFTNGWWGLQVNPEGTQLSFGTSTNGHGMTNLSANITWVSNQWYQVMLACSLTESALYVDGQLLATGSPVTVFPNAGEMTNGFRIGSDEHGNNQAEGAFDELETFATPLTEPLAVADTYWLGIPDYKSDPNGLLAAWQTRFFGHFGLDPNGDYDNDGTNDLQEFQNGNDPNKVSFALSFSNQFVVTNIVSGIITISGGTPSMMAVLVDYTNFSGAIWTNYYGTSLTVDIGTNQGPHDVWIGLRGLPSDARQTWVLTTFILDSVPPTIVITNPADNAAFNASRVNISGNFTSAGLKQITVNGVLAFVNGANFEAVNVPLDGGTNAILALIENLNGETNYSLITLTGNTNMDGSMNSPVQLSATPVAGVVPLPVTFQVQTTTPGTLQQVVYDFNGDGVADLITNSLSSLTYTYATNGEYFPVVTIQTTAGRFSSVGGWNAVVFDLTNQPIRINVMAPFTQVLLIPITDPVDLKWIGTNLYVLSGSGKSITKFNTNGTLIGSPLSLSAISSGFDVDAAGNIYVAMTASNQVWKFFPTNSSFMADTNFGDGGCIGLTNGLSGTDSNAFNAPFDVAVSPNGVTISISDSVNNRIQQFLATNGMFIASFGTNGADIGQFNTPKGLTYDSIGTLYVADSGNHRIVLANGSSLLSATGTNGTALGEFDGPENISISERGVYVADAGNNRIQKFDAPPGHGTFTIAPGSIRYGFNTNFSGPKAVAAMNEFLEEKFWVADTGHDQVVLYKLAIDDPTPAWTSMTNCIAINNTLGAIRFFSNLSAEDYNQDFHAIGTANAISAINQIGTLTPIDIQNDKAEYYFEQTIGSQTLTFKVVFVKENGVWKIFEF